jgi:hypothetical protein
MVKARRKFEVVVKWLDTRYHNFDHSHKYSTMAVFPQNEILSNSGHWSVVLSNFQSTGEEGTSKAEAWFLMPDHPENWLKAGESFKMVEGSKVSAQVYVIGELG